MIIGAAWLKEKDGKKYMSCQIEVPGMDISFALFKNDKKDKDNQPDYHIVWSKARQKTQGSAATTTESDPHFSDDDIPF
jgi:uncharacterized protein (DUF736 family)